MDVTLGATAWPDPISICSSRWTCCSHGIGGIELGHSVLAQALARNGYLVAALCHPGDNWQDRSLMEKSPERYFDERPRQASRVIDAILVDPLWKDRIASDGQGPRVGALGHSAGGYTVLALAGARPDLSRLRQHCQAEALEDPILCSIGRPGHCHAAVASGHALAEGRARAGGQVAEPESLLEVLVVALDAPTHLGLIHHARQRRVFGQRGPPILERRCVPPSATR